MVSRKCRRSPGKRSSPWRQRAHSIPMNSRSLASWQAFARRKIPMRTFGQGMQGYAKRYGAAFADQVDGNIMVGGVYPTILKIDPRYFRLGKGPFAHRFGYAISRIFVARKDSGGSICSTFPNLRATRRQLPSPMSIIPPTIGLFRESQQLGNADGPRRLRK